MFKLIALLALLTASLSASADTYVKVTSADDLVVGENYIIVESSSSTTYILAGAISKGKFTAITTGFTISDDKSTIITSTATPNEYKIGSSSTYYTLKNGNNFLGYSSDTNLRFSTTSNTNKEKWTISSNSTYGYVIVNAATTNRGIGRNGEKIGAYLTTDYANFKPCVIYKKQVSITVTGVSISPTTATMTVGDTQTLTATVSPDNATNKTVTWSTSAPGVATVDSNTGEVTAVAPGTATITATTEDGSYTASCTVTVNPASTKTPVNMTTFSATNTTLIVGETTTTTVANDQENWTAAYTYSSSNSDVASVNESGVITAVSKGTATITATLNVSSEDENYRIGNITSKSVEITVNNPSHTAHFSINGTIDSNNDCTTEEGESITFPANPEDIYGKKFVGWTTSSISGTQSTAPDVLLSEGTMPTEDMTYYAVFATEVSGTQETTKTYGFETETDDDWIIDGPTRNSEKAATDMYAGKINSNNTYVTFKKKVNVKNFSFAFTRTSTNENYNVYIETSTDGTTWTAVETYPMSGFNSDGTFLTKSKDFDGETSLYTRFHCYNTTAVRYVDDVSITYNEDVITYTEYATTVTEPIVLKSIAITKQPTKTSYTEGETFTPEGMVVTATYSDNSEKEVTNYTYEPNGQLTTANTTVTITYTEENYLKETITKTASLSITVVEKPKHTITFSINRETTTEQVTEGFSVPFPETVNNVKGKVFMGWVNEPLDLTDEEPTYIDTATETVGLTDATYYAVFATCTPGDISYIVDTITVSKTGAEVGVSSYRDWKDKTFPSNAVYAGNSAGGSNIDPCIQMRSDNSNSGIVSTTSGGYVTKIEIVWNNSTDRKLNIYGSNTAYTDASDLYNSSKQGTLLGSLSSKSDETILEISGDYKYIGLRSKDGALYLHSISITWMNEAPDTYSGYCTTVTTGETSIGSGNEDPVSKKYYATYSSTQAFVVPEDVTVAQVIEKNGLIYLERYAAGDVVEANTGVLLESENTITTAFELTNKEATNLGVTNVLKASGAGITADEMGAADDPANNYFYRLTKGTLNGETVFGFYWKKTDGSAFDLGANKAYLVLPKSNVQSAPRYVWLGGQTTAIDGLNADTEATVGSDERIYSLDGRRVEGQLKRGIYVKNGKKFIVR